MWLSHQTPILLVGGLAMKGDEYFLLAKQLTEKLERQVVYFDNINVGSGLRHSSENSLTILDQALHQWNKVSEAFNSNTTISIYGISMGGMIASTMATLFPLRAHKLVLAATSANLPHNPAIPKVLFEKWSNAKHEDDIRATTRIAFGKTTIESNPHIYEDYFQYRISGKNQQKVKEFIQQLISIRNFNGSEIYSKLATIPVETTILSGSEDQLFDDTHLNDITSLLPQAQCKSLLDTGHMLHLENLNSLVECLTSNKLL